MRAIFGHNADSAYGPLAKIRAPRLDQGERWRPPTPGRRQRVHGYRGVVSDSSGALQKPVPGPLFEWVKRASWIELAIFAALIAFWLLPGFDSETFIFGLTHGIGYILLCLLIWVTVLRREAPYTLLAATLTPVGPLGSVIAIEWIERAD